MAIVPCNHDMFRRTSPVIYASFFVFIAVFTIFDVTNVSLFFIPEISYKTNEIVDNEREQLHNFALNCLNNSQSIYGFENVPIILNDTARQLHFEWILNKTSIYRGYPSHCWAGYCGPWIEELWISRFGSSNLSNFGPYIPLFIDWLNIWKKLNSPRKYRQVISGVFSLLSKDYIYITVVQSSFGIEGMHSKLIGVPPNLLILNPAGKGHVPIPHLMKEKPIMPEPSPKIKVIFGGNEKAHKSRLKSIRDFKLYFGPNFQSGKWNNWENEFLSSEFVLSPRGYGRAAFRTFEALQMGMIPIVTYDDYLWIPYKNSINWSKIAVIGNVTYSNETISYIESISRQEQHEMRKNILSLRESHFTYDGLMNQIANFMTSGYKKSDLRCDRYFVYE